MAKTRWSVAACQTLAVGAAAALGSALLIATPTPAAAAECYGQGCKWQDAYTTG